MAETTFLQQSDMEGKKMKVIKSTFNGYEVYQPIVKISGAGDEIIEDFGSRVFSSINDGRKVVATAGTRERLVNTPTPCKRVIITALLSNTEVVVVGGETVIAEETNQRGTPLLPGQSFPVDIDDLYKIWLDAIVDGEGVTFSYFN